MLLSEPDAFSFASGVSMYQRKFSQSLWSFLHFSYMYTDSVALDCKTQKVATLSSLILLPLRLINYKALNQTGSDDPHLSYKNRLQINC